MRYANAPARQTRPSGFRPRFSAALGLVLRDGGALVPSFAGLPRSRRSCRRTRIATCPGRAESLSHRRAPRWSRGLAALSAGVSPPPGGCCRSATRRLCFSLGLLADQSAHIADLLFRQVSLFGL